MPGGFFVLINQNVQPLEFCNWYRKQSCCLPAFDVDIYEHFAPLIAAGDTCAKYQNKAKYYLSLVFCYGCDPEEPTHFTTPLNDAFFNASFKTAKICSSVTKHMAPAAFSDCGLTIADDRENPCSGTSPIAPAAVWFDCEDGQYMCMDSSKNWYCSDSACGTENTPLGFMDARCNASEHTCDAALMFLNDNRGAKPPNYNDYPVEIVDEVQCLETYGNASRCKCLRNPSGASKSIDMMSIGSLAIVLTGMIALVS